MIHVFKLLYTIFLLLVYGMFGSIIYILWILWYFKLPELTPYYQFREDKPLSPYFKSQPEHLFQRYKNGIFKNCYIYYSIFHRILDIKTKVKTE
jgi:hypothetical protein